MPRPSTGQARFRHGRWEIRVTLRKGDRPTFVLDAAVARGEADEPAARARARFMAEMAATLRKADRLDLAPILLADAARCSDAELPEVTALVDAAAKGNARLSPVASNATTFEQLATLWTSGQLAERYPDHVKAKATAADDVGRLTKWVYPLVGSVPVASFTIDHAERIMAALSPKLTTASRRHVAQLLHRVLALAVFPMRLLAANPLPRGWLPKPPRRKAKAFLYPTEEAQLLGCRKVPLELRMLYGFLAREGMRKSEALGLQWRDVDLERGVVTLDENKTDEPRAWVLGGDVVAALARWRELRGDPDESADVFTTPAGAPVGKVLAAELRMHLELAGLKRAQLFESSDARAHYDVHAHRGTFVTLALAAGQTETWVTDRTGHKSSMMVHRYKRASRTAAELGLGWLHPMHQVIPELKGRAKRRAVGKTSGGGGRRRRGSPTKQGQCTRRDSNPHTLRYRNLNPARLPVPPLVLVRGSLAKGCRGSLAFPAMTRWACFLGIAALLAGCGDDEGEGRTGGGAAPSAGAYFPGGWMYERVDGAPVHPESDEITAWLEDNGGWGTGEMRVDFSIEVLGADADTPMLAFQPTDDFYEPDCDLVPVPVPEGGVLEGEEGYACESDGDCHLIVRHDGSGRLYEMWRADITGAVFRGGCLAAWDMTRVYGPESRGEQCSSADAAGFPIAPLLFTVDEVAAGEIAHAIRFILPNARMREGFYTRPAVHAGAPSGPAPAPVYGSRWRLRADYDVDGLPSEGARVVARAMQIYGMALADGGNIALTAQSDRLSDESWEDWLDTRDLTALVPSDFEVVDTGPLIELTYDCVRTPY